ncbi:TPA: RHS domain-containing protein, partial [Aeromonas dhakensis]|nr:RHS domain-containing protein [Aeromonas dhakensis]
DGQPLSSQQAQAEPLRRYDAAGRVSQIGPNQYRYDKCGRLSEKVVSRPGFRPQTTQFEWDGFDRLQRVILPDGSRWRYRYDPFGRRIGKEREGQVSQLTAITRVHYRWDGDQLVQQQSYRADGNAARQVQWVYEPGSFRPLAQWETGEQDERLHYIVTDVAGTARELCSEAGDIIWRGEQRLWGNCRADAIPQPLRRFLGDAANDETYCELRYQGQLYDQETGLYYNRHRYFDPELGQYISPDPIGFAGGLRPQGYVHNPLEWVDPLGLSGCPGVTKETGYGPNDPPVRIEGDWSVNDMKAALLGHPPKGLGKPDLHHADQMPGSGIHEIVPELHRGNKSLHPNKFNQGVTPEMRDADRKLHWWYRAREQGADDILPDWIYD